MATIKKYTKKDGSTAYMFNAYLGVDPATGKKKYTTRRGFKTQKEANLTYSRLQVEIEKNGFKINKKYTFQEMYDLWLESAYKNTVRESTLVKTIELFDNHILPAFGSIKLEKITVIYCQRKVNEWSSKIVNFKRLKNYVVRVLNYAIRLEALDSNPMKKVEVPKIKKDVLEERFENYYNKKELKVFLLHVKNDFSLRWYAIFRTLAFTGFRKGELLALQWQDVDFEGKSITINKTVTRGLNNALIVQPPKTKESVRTISVDDMTLNVLNDWRKQQAKDMLKMGFNTMNKNQLVFSTLENKHIQPANTTHRINTIIERHNLKRITTHGLRATHCSLLFEAGAPIQVVKERLGHADIQTTMNIYTFVTPKSKEDTAEKFAKYMNF